jgi:hypothetical protein
VAQRMRCAPRRDKRRLNWFLNPSFGWNHPSIPSSTAQFIAFVSLTNSGTVPEFSIVVPNLGKLPQPFYVGIAFSLQLFSMD